MQVDDGYPSDRIMLKEHLNSWTFTNDTLLVRNDPCPSITTPENLDHRAKIGSNQYRFPFTYSDWTGCASEPGDLLVVRPTLLACTLNAWARTAWLMFTCSDWLGYAGQPEGALVVHSALLSGQTVCLSMSPD